jgi:hypothetical protein
MEVDACYQPAAWLFHETVVMIADVKEVVGLGKYSPMGFLPCQAGIGEEVGLVITYRAIEIGV